MLEKTRERSRGPETQSSLGEKDRIVLNKTQLTIRGR